MTEFKNQYHFFQPFSLTDAKLGKNIDFDINVVFPVKKVKVNLAYSIEADAPILLLATSSLVDGDVVCNVSKYNFTAVNTNLWYLNGFNESDNVSYIFKVPKTILGNISVKFVNQLAGSIQNAADANNATIHFEFLG